ncbi:MAG TPA: TMEM175 family protein [Vicinamibacterales bacterium]|nr:TMEM175 family protein [Vicinamibacterales bacterium]
MNKARLEAFSDGVLAVIITIMVLELKAPAGASLDALRGVLPTFCAYTLSFVVVGIYWNNHHHMLHAADRINGASQWANLHLLFWLSLVPFTTNWMGDHYTEAWPTAVYGAVLIMAACAYTLLQTILIRASGAHSRLRHAVGSDAKGKLSIACYATAIAAAFFMPWIADALYVLVAAIWFVPDRRIETELRPTSPPTAR